jgi:dTDP-4-dehydrorhamnose reductase
MKILIIGADGQLGTDCCQLLAQQHVLVTPGLDQLNLCDQSSVEKIVSDERPEVIINCAAYTAVNKCEEERDLCWRINADGPRHLAAAAECVQARLVHISTDYVFDGLRTAPDAYTEDDATSPLSHYGRSKLAGEEAVCSLSTNYMILRTAWLYSAHGPNFLKTMLRLSVQNPGRELKVVNDQYGSLTWSFTLARQIQRLLTTKMSGIIHSTAEGHTTWYAGACYFLEAMKIPYNLKPCTTADYPTLTHRPANSILANTRLNKEGLSTFTHWQHDIDVFVDRFRERLLAEIPPR